MKLLQAVEMESEEPVDVDAGISCTNKARKIKPSPKIVASDLHKRIYKAK